MSELPESWAQVPLAVITSDVTQRVPSSDETIRYIDIGSVNRTTKTIETPQKLLGKDAPSRARKQVAAGDTLVSMTRPNLNAVALVPKELDGEIASTGFDVLRPVPGVDPRWISYLVRTEKFVDSMSALVQGALYPAVRSKDVRAHVVPLAPAAEQTRIANQLDTLLARIQSCNDRFDTIPALLKRFQQAVLNSAITGELTKGWRDAQSERLDESPTPDWAEAKALRRLPEGWRWAKFSEFISGVRSGTSAVPKSEPGSYPVLRSSAVRALKIDFEDVRYLPDLAKVRVDDLLVEGDLLFTRLSGSLEYVANCAVVRGLSNRKIYYPDRLFRAQLIRSEQGPYFEYCFASSLLRAHLTIEAKSTAGHQRVSMGTVTEFPIPLPPDREQAEIVRRVEALTSLANRIEARANAARTQAQRLSPLLLAKAFRGELAPQDPQDEPASVLLERIASQRTEPAAKKQSKPPRQVRASRAPKEAAAVTKSRQDKDVKGKPYLADHLRRLGSPTTAEVLFKASELPIGDFYKQLAWEVAQGHIGDAGITLEARHAVV